jgi:hypothetical protein
MRTDEVLVFLHVQHTGGTLVSLVLGHTFSQEAVCPGSRMSNIFFGKTLNQTAFKHKLSLWGCTRVNDNNTKQSMKVVKDVQVNHLVVSSANDVNSKHCKVSFFHEDYSFVEAFRANTPSCTAIPIIWLREPVALRVSYYRSIFALQHNNKSTLAKSFEDYVDQYFETTSNKLKDFHLLSRTQKQQNMLEKSQLNAVLGQRSVGHNMYHFTNRMTPTYKILVF